MQDLPTTREQFWRGWDSLHEGAHRTTWRRPATHTTRHGCPRCVERPSLKSHRRHASGSPTVAARHVHARLSRKRGTQLPLPFLCTPSIATTKARRSRSAADRNRGGITARLPQRRAVTPLPAPQREGRSPGPARSSRDTVEHQGQPRLSGVFPRTNTRRGMIASAAEAESSKAFPASRHSPAPSTHRHTPSNTRPAPVTPRLPRRHSRRGRRDPIAPQKGLDCRHPRWGPPLPQRPAGASRL